MSTKIRLARGGSKKRPFYRIVVADSHAPRDGAFIERVGSYNPLLGKDNDARVELKADRIEHWLKQGAQPSERVLRFINKAKIGQDVKLVKEMTKKLDNVIELKKAEIEARKKAEAEEAKRKAEEEAKQKAEEEAAAKAEAEEKAAAEEAPAEEETKEE